MIALLENHKIRNTIRTIALVLVIAFLAYDIAWAYPDKLAAPSFFKDGGSHDRAIAGYIVAKIENNGIPQGKITLTAVERILNNLNGWLTENGISWEGSKGEVLIRFSSSGYAIRYFDPTIVKPEKYTNEEVFPHTVSLNPNLSKQVLEVKAVPPPSDTSVRNLEPSPGLPSRQSTSGKEENSAHSDISSYSDENRPHTIQAGKTIQSAKEFLLNSLKAMWWIAEWRDVFKKIRELDPEGCEETVIILDKGEMGRKIFKAVVPKDVTGDRRRHIIRYLAICINNLAMTIGAERIKVYSAFYDDIIDEIERNYKQIAYTLEPYFGKKFEIQPAAFEESRYEEIKLKPRAVEPFSPRLGKALGIDIGGTNIQIVVIENGEAIYKDYISTWSHERRDIKELIKRIEELIEQAIAKVGKVEAIGIATAGVVRNDEVTYRSDIFDMPDFEEFKKIGDRIRKRFGVTVAVANDGDAEGFLGLTSREVRNALFLKLGTGLGGVYVDENGFLYGVGEYGRVVINMAETEPAPRHATTGTKGVVQQYPTSRGVARIAKQLGMGDVVSAEEIREKLEEGDRKARRVLEIIGNHMAATIAEISNYLKIDEVVLGGGVTLGESGRVIVDTAQETLKNRYPHLSITISLSDLDLFYGGAMGAAQLANQKQQSERSDILIAIIDTSYQTFQKHLKRLGDGFSLDDLMIQIEFSNVERDAAILHPDIALLRISLNRQLDIPLYEQVQLAAENVGLERDIEVEQRIARAQIGAEKTIMGLKRKEKDAQRSGDIEGLFEAYQGLSAKVSEWEGIMRQREALVKKGKIDLHIHTSQSDAPPDATPENVGRQAIRSNVKTIGVPEHNIIVGAPAMQGVAGRLLREDLILDVIPGTIELSLQHKELIKGEVHCRLSHADFDNEELVGIIEGVREAHRRGMAHLYDEFKGLSRDALVHIIEEKGQESDALKKLKLEGEDFDNIYQEVVERLRRASDEERARFIDEASRLDNFAEAVLSRGQSNRHYRVVREISKPPAEDYLLDAVVVLKRIRSADPCTSIILNHFWKYKGKVSEFIELLAKEGLIDGIEVEYSSYTSEERERAYEIADKHGLKYSGGSDSHDLDRQEGSDGRLGSGVKNNVNVTWEMARWPRERHSNAHNQRAALFYDEFLKTIKTGKFDPEVFETAIIEYERASVEFSGEFTPRDYYNYEAYENMAQAYRMAAQSLRPGEANRGGSDSGTRKIPLGSPLSVFNLLFGHASPLTLEEIFLRTNCAPHTIAGDLWSLRRLNLLKKQGLDKEARYRLRESVRRLNPEQIEGLREILGILKAHPTLNDIEAVASQLKSATGISIKAISQASRKRSKDSSSRKKWTKEEIIRTIQSWHEEGLDLSYTASLERNRSLVIAATQKRYFGRWRKAIEAAGLDYDLVKKRRQEKQPRKWSRNKIVYQIRKLSRQGADLSESAVHKSHPNLYSAARKYFGSWRTAIKAAGLDYERIAKKRWRWKPEEIIDEFQRIDSEGEEMSFNNIKAKHSRLFYAAVSHFGSYYRALAAARIDFDESRVRRLRFISTDYVAGLVGVGEERIKGLVRKGLLPTKLTDEQLPEAVKLLTGISQVKREDYQSLKIPFISGYHPDEDDYNPEELDRLFEKWPHSLEFVKRFLSIPSPNGKDLEFLGLLAKVINNLSTNQSQLELISSADSIAEDKRSFILSTLDKGQQRKRSAESEQDRGRIRIAIDALLKQIKDSEYIEINRRSYPFSLIWQEGRYKPKTKAEERQSSSGASQDKPTSDEIIENLDASPNILWDLIKDDAEARQEFRNRCELLLKSDVVTLLKDKIRELAEDGKISVQPDDIEKIDIVVFGDWFRGPKNARSEDLDIIVLFKGEGTYQGKLRSRFNLPPLSVAILSLKDCEERADVAKKLALILRGNEVIIYGGSLIFEIGFRPLLTGDILYRAKSLLETGDIEESLGDLGEPRRRWERYFEALLYIQDLLSKTAKDELKNFLKGYIDAQPGSPQKQALKSSLGEDFSFEDFFIQYYLGRIEVLPWSMPTSKDLIERFGRVVSGLVDDVAGHLLTLETDKGLPIEAWCERFPDGEWHLRILNPLFVKDAKVNLTSNVDSPDDLVRLVLLMDMLRMYGAKNIQLVLEKPYIIANGLDGLLSFYCDGIAYRDGEEIKELEVLALEPIKERRRSVWVDRVLYRYPRLKKDVEEAAASINAKTERVEIVKDGPSPLSWNVHLSSHVRNENVVLVHNTQDNEDIAELWLMLIALRRAGASSISLVNTYEGYARQDKVFEAGEGISAITMLKMMNALVDNHLVLNIHYGKRSGWVRLKGQQLYNLNAFVQVAEKLVDVIAGWSGRDNLVEELKAHPILVVSPDDGALGYVREAARILPKYIKDKYGIDVNVHYGYMDKKRISATEVRMGENILGDDGKPIKDIGDVKAYWALVIDDETSQGSTLLAATYALVRRLGIPWQRVLTGVVHGKLARGLKPFETGWSKEDIKMAIEPKPEYINETKGLMPPRLIATTESLALPGDFPDEQKVLIGSIVTYAVKRIIGKSKNIAPQERRSSSGVPSNEGPSAVKLRILLMNIDFHLKAANDALERKDYDHLLTEYSAVIKTAQLIIESPFAGEFKNQAEEKVREAEIIIARAKKAIQDSEIEKRRGPEENGDERQSSSGARQFARTPLPAELLKTSGICYYPAAGVDVGLIKSVLELFPGINEFIFVDPAYLKFPSLDKLSSLMEYALSEHGYELIFSSQDGELGRGGKVTYIFKDRKGVERTLKLYAEDALNFSAPETTRGYDMAIAKYPGDLGRLPIERPEFYPNLISGLQEGGYLLVSYTIPPIAGDEGSELGMRRIGRPFENIALYQKIKPDELKERQSSSGAEPTSSESSLATATTVNVGKESLTMTTTTEKVVSLLSYMHNPSQYQAGIGTNPIPQGAQIALSEGLFDAEERITLDPILAHNKSVMVLPLNKIFNLATNQNSTRHNLIVVMTEEEFNDSRTWNGLDKNLYIKSGVLIVKDRLTGPNYLYLEGVIKLAIAMLNDDRESIRAYYEALTGSSLDDETLNTLEMNHIAFAIKAMLKFRPIEPLNKEELDDCRRQMEVFLSAA